MYKFALGGEKKKENNEDESDLETVMHCDRSIANVNIFSTWVHNKNVLKTVDS